MQKRSYNCDFFFKSEISIAGKVCNKNQQNIVRLTSKGGCFFQSDTLYNVRCTVLYDLFLQLFQVFLNNLGILSTSMCPISKFISMQAQIMLQFLELDVKRNQMLKWNFPPTWKNYQSISFSMTKENQYLVNDYLLD